jgi:hypothetical protein
LLEEQSGDGNKIKAFPDLGAIPDGGIEGGGVARRPLVRKVGKLAQGEGARAMYCARATRAL